MLTYSHKGQALAYSSLIKKCPDFRRSDRAGCLVERRPIASYRWTFHLTRANRWGRAYAGTGGSDGHAEESDPKRGGAFCIPYTGAAHTGRMDSRTSAEPNARRRSHLRH